MAATKESPGLLESVGKGAAISLALFGAIALFQAVLPAMLVSWAVSTAAFGGAFGAGWWGLVQAKNLVTKPKAA